jgi:hypothetical protein
MRSDGSVRICAALLQTKGLYHVDFGIKALGARDTSESKILTAETI